MGCAAGILIIGENVKNAMKAFLPNVETKCYTVRNFQVGHAACWS